MVSVRYFENFATVVAIAFCACCIMATCIVLFGHPPSVFNQSQKANLAIKCRPYSAIGICDWRTVRVVLLFQSR